VTSPPDEVYIVSYDHGGLVLWGYEHFLQHLRDTLGWLDRHPKLKMGLDNEAWTYDWLAENRPAVLAELREALQRYRGRFGIATCTYGQPLAAFLLEESNIRQIALGLETTSERLGYDVSVYAFSEHAAFPQLPQVLTGLGIRRALLRTHYLMYGYCPGYDLPIAWWQAPDGTRVACVPTYKHQERQAPEHQAQPPGPFGLTTEDTWILTRYPSAGAPDSLDAFRARFAHIQPLLATRLDDSSLKREELVSELDQRDDYRWATLEQVFDEFPEPTTTIAPTAEEFGLRMPWGYRGNELFDLARRAEIAVLTAERLLARCTADPMAIGRRAALPAQEWQLRQAWKDLLVGQHHDVQIVARAGALGRERLLASLERTQRMTRSLLRAQADGSGDDASYIAFNPLPWPRTEPQAALPDGTPLAGPVTAPALGFATLTPAAAATPLAGLSFCTDHYRAAFDAEGGLAALRSADGRDLFRSGCRSGHLAAVIEGEQLASKATATQVFRETGGYRVVECGMLGPLPFATTWHFPHTGSRIDYRLTVRFDGERIGAPTDHKRDSRSAFTHEQKLRARFFPALIDDVSGVYDVPFGVATTQRPYVEGNYWTALAGGDGGLAIANRGTMGSVREDDGAFSVPLAFSTNYVWGAEVVCGERHWELGLLPFRGEWQAASLHRRALEFAFPIVAVPGALAQHAPDFLAVANPSIHLTALYSVGGHGFVRLYNGSDQQQLVDLDWPTGQSLTPVDLRHQPVAVEFPFRLRPWQIRTYRLW
jgi:alpha-mannosidase